MFCFTVDGEDPHNKRHKTLNVLNHTHPYYFRCKVNQIGSQLVSGIEPGHSGHSWTGSNQDHAFEGMLTIQYLKFEGLISIVIKIQGNISTDTSR